MTLSQLLCWARERLLREGNCWILPSSNHILGFPCIQSKQALFSDFMLLLSLFLLIWQVLGTMCIYSVQENSNVESVVKEVRTSGQTSIVVPQSHIFSRKQKKKKSSFISSLIDLNRRWTNNNLGRHVVHGPYTFSCLPKDRTFSQSSAALIAWGL